MRRSFNELVEFANKTYLVLKGGYLALAKPFVFATTEFHLDSHRGEVIGFYCSNEIEDETYNNCIDYKDFNGTENDGLFVLECIKKLASYDNVPEIGDLDINPYIEDYLKFEAVTKRNDE